MSLADSLGDLIGDIIGNALSPYETSTDHGHGYKSYSGTTGSKRNNTISYVDENGYLRFNDSDILVHRYVAQKKLGRWLEPWEVVHHIDGNKRNNNPSNLWVCSQQEHDRIHEQNKRIYGTWHEPKNSRKHIVSRKW